MLVQTDIKPSKIQPVFYGGAVLCVLLIVLFSGIAISNMVMILLAVLLFAVLQYRYSKHKQRFYWVWLQQHSVDDWQLTVKLNPLALGKNIQRSHRVSQQLQNKPITFNARLTEMVHYGWVLRLHFTAQHPLFKNIPCIIYKDQVSDNTWRRLVVQAKLYQYQK